MIVNSTAWCALPPCYVSGVLGTILAASLALLTNPIILFALFVLFLFGWIKLSPKHLLILGPIAGIMSRSIQMLILYIQNPKITFTPIAAGFAGIAIDGLVIGLILCVAKYYWLTLRAT